MNLPAVSTFDWKHPDYSVVIRERIRRLEWLRAERARRLEWIKENPGIEPAAPDIFEDLKAYYREDEHVADFINDWGWLYEPRNVEVGLPASIPFVIFERQRQYVDFVLRKWRERRNGAAEKARDCGCTWLSVGIACTLSIFHDGFSAGFGSRTVDHVDKIGTMKPIFPKVRKFMASLPEEFRAGWVEWRDAPYMRCTFPDTGSLIAGEGGSQIGRGDRTAMYFVDEAEHLEQPEQVEMSLSETTNCRIDVSSVNGSANPVAQKILTKKVEVFYFDWRDDPRKGPEWYAKRCEDLDPVVVAQEIDRDRSASVQGILIPGTWVRAAVGAHKKLGIAPSGARRLALDVADEGRDKCAMVGGQGVEISVAEEWSGKDSDTFATTQRAFEIADEHGVLDWDYDADGLGAFVRGDARVVNEQRKAAGRPQHRIAAFRGSGSVVDPEAIVEGTRTENDQGRTNEDYFLNRKAQAWWSLRRRFHLTYLWVEKGRACAPDDIISIAEELPNLRQLEAELSQPTYRQNGAGKMFIDKRPAGQPSPNLADGAMMRYAPRGPEPLAISPEVLRAVAMSPRRRRF